MTKTLAIETSCDDTSLGIVSFDGKTFQVEKIFAYSQIHDHQKYGGVVPEVASRLHSEKIIAVLEALGRDEIKNVDFISVTTHPGLPGALVVGKATAHLLASFFDKPVIQVNHIHGHIFSLLLERNMDEIQFPLVVLTASGGHNDLYVIESENLEMNKIGQTLDDAAGECFDKVARMLGGPYPGGQRISEMAQRYKEGESREVKFKRIFLSKEGFDFSFSGMKSQVSGLLKQYETEGIVLDDALICAIAHEFQEAVVEVLAKKLIRAGIKYGAKKLGIAGGVSCNERLREYLNAEIRRKNSNVTPMRPMKKLYSTDNAAMIGVAGILEQQKKPTE